jgi:GrpB-like predicted nucleotidyltransferase (UPF0157 family)
VDGIELIGGPERREIRVVPWEAAWQVAFELQRRRIAGALGDRALRIDHIGSTAVPGLPAKPIVDIDLSVADPDDEAAWLPALEDAGYVLRVREPGHRMVRTPERDVHVHVCATGSDWERRHLLFRDRLRADADDREAYAAVKVELAAREWADMNDYAAAKSEVVAMITERAERWAAATGWRVR